VAKLSRDDLISWRTNTVAAVSDLKDRVGTLISATKKLGADAKRVVNGISGAAEKLSHAMEGAVEDRHSKIMADLIKEHGKEEADLMVDTDDYPDTSKEDERDENACAALNNLETPDIDDATDQAIESLDGLEDGLQQLLAGLKEIR
jgi:hypothetical protein